MLIRGQVQRHRRGHRRRVVGRIDLTVASGVEISDLTYLRESVTSDATRHGMHFRGERFLCAAEQGDVMTACASGS
jgi:hypothetical protein